MGFLQTKSAVPNNQQSTINKPAGQQIGLGAKPANVSTTAPKVPVVAQIPQTAEAIAEQTAEQTAKVEAKSFVNDLTPETKAAVKERVMQNVEAALAAQEISTMVLSHLCFVSPTSIKSRGRDTNSANEVIIAQYNGEKRTANRETKIGTSLASYVAGLDSAGQAEFLKIAVNPVALSQLMKQLNLKA